MTTASAPSGIGAPVKMRTASPAGSGLLIDARCLFADYRWLCPWPAVARNDGITIHGGIIKNRNCETGENIPRRKIFERVRERRHARRKTDTTISRI